MFDPKKGVGVAAEKPCTCQDPLDQGMTHRKDGPCFTTPAPAEELKCHPSCTYGKAEAGPICRKHQAEKDAADSAQRLVDEKAQADVKAAVEAGEKAAAPPNPLADVKFPPLDNLGSHFYDNEAGTFWIGLNLRNDPFVLTLTIDGAKLAMLQASLDFRGREQRKSSLITRVKESVGGMKEGLEKMLGRVGAGAKKSILSR